MVPTLPTVDLLKRAVSGDQTALTELIRQFEPELRVRFGKEIPRRWQAFLSLDDLLQETYTDAFLDITRLRQRDEASFRRWLTRIAGNNLMHAIESLSAEKHGGGRVPFRPDQQDDSFLGLYELLGCTTTTPSRQVARAEAKAALEQAIGKLPAEHQMVVRMYDIEGHPAHDVAQVMKRSEGAVFMLRARAHRTLSKLLGAPVKNFSDFA